MRELLHELNAALDHERPCVYCTIVETRGSTPQKAGAAMLVYPDGSQAGTLGGGCVEAEVKRQALRVLAGEDARTSPDLFTFNLDDNYGWDDGLICGGRMQILADPFSTTGLASRQQQVRDYYRIFDDHVERGVGCTEAVITANQGDIPLGSRYLFDAQDQPLARLGREAGFALAAQHLKSLRSRPRSYLVQEIAYLPTLPRITLLIVGGGHVGKAVANLAADVDFETWILDDRATYVSKDRFPHANRHIVGDIGIELARLAQKDITSSVYVLIITRGHSHDEEALFHVAHSQAGYVGMIGSKRKIKLIFDDLRAKGIRDDALDRVHAPLGFAIGSQTVPEIAVSIVAELIACRNLGASIPAARMKAR